MGWGSTADIAPVALIRQLLTPRSIALVGATENSFWSRAIIQNLTTLGYAGDLHLVHPTKPEQFSRPCYPSVPAIPAPVDHAYVMTGTRHAMNVLADCAAKGVRSVTMLTAGFRETNDEGAAREQEVATFCRANDIALLGPNCLGFVNARAPVPAYALIMGDAPLAGGVGVLLASGALLGHVHRLARNRSIGLSYLVSSGNEAVLDSADYLNFLVEDPDTKVVGALLEGIRRPAAFARVARRAVDLGKPIVVLKAGKSNAAARSAVAHTAALTGADAVVDAFFRDLGVIRVDGVEALVETLGFFQAYGWPEGRRAGVVTPSGGACGVVSDLCHESAIELPDFSPETKAKLREILPEFATPQNPMDTTGVIVLDATLIPKSVDAVVADPRIDFVAVVQDVARDAGPVPGRNEERMQLLKDAMARSPKFICAMNTVAQDLTPYGRDLVASHGVHFANGLSHGVAALDRAVRYARARTRIHERGDFPLPAGRATGADQTPRGVRRTLSEIESKTLLRDFGILTAPERVAGSVDEAVAAAADIGYPVVLKVVSPDLPHKTDAGAVVLDLRSPGAVREAYWRILEAARRYRPDARIEGVLVAEQIEGAVEMILGVSVDPLFGPVVLLGLGGILAEVIQDVSLALPPIAPSVAEEMLASLKGRAVLDGLRGRPAADVTALVDALVRVGDLSVELSDRLVALDVNPLLVLPRGQGVRAADALLVMVEGDARDAAVASGER